MPSRATDRSNRLASWVLLVALTAALALGHAANSPIARAQEATAIVEQAGAAPSANLAEAADSTLVLQQRQALVAAVDRVAPCVVSIETIGGLERVGQVLFGAGPTTGLVVSSDGYIISSAFNFAQKPTSILVGLPDGTRTPAKLVATDRNRMLVLLKITIDDPLSVPVAAPQSETQVGQWAIAVGRTFGSQPNMSVGIVSALHRIWDKALQTDAKVSPANYGGPLIDVQGRVLGVLVPLSPQANSEVAGVEWYDSGIGFAIPYEDVLKIVPRMREGKDLVPGIMGVNLKPGEMYNEPAEVVSSRPNSPAYKAGIKAGDVVVEIEGREVKQRYDMLRELNRRYAGDKIQVAVTRAASSGPRERIEVELELIDKLDPYARPLLGILPQRTTTADGGVLVRFVYPDSPAAKAGVKPGDRITQLGNEAIAGRVELASQLAHFEVGIPVTLHIQRGSEKLELTATLAADSNQLPGELPPVLSGEAVTPAEEIPAVGKVDIKVAEFANEAFAYVPADFDPARSYGLLLWLHGNDLPDVEQLVKRWGPLCDAGDFILLAPKASDASRWRSADQAYLRKLLEQVMADYRVDPLRVVVHGQQTGGATALALAFAERERVRGVAIVQAAISARPPENDPQYRLAFFVALSEAENQARQLDAIRKMKYDIHTVSQGKRGRYLNDEELAAMLRWFDSLDKI